MSKTSFLKRGAAGVVAAVSLLPVAAFAATPTPQQVINSYIGQAASNGSSLSSGEVRINLSERNFSDPTAKSAATVLIVVDEKKIPVSGQMIPDGQGTIRIKTVEGSGSFSMPTLSDPGVIEWKIVNGVGYIRVSNVSDVVRAFLAMRGVNADQAVGTWAKIDPTEICGALGELCPMVGGILSSSISTADDALKKQPISVTGVEKRWTATNGDKMIRVRARINPALIANMETEQIKAVAKNDAQRAQKLAAIRTQFKNIRDEATHTQMAINVNLTKGTIERVETGYAQTTAKKSCSLNAARKQVCRTTGSQTVSVLSGINVGNGPVAPVTAPESSVSAVTLVQQALPYLLSLQGLVK